MSKGVRPILGCVPMHKKDRLGLPWKPSPGCTYEKYKCPKCKTLVWLGTEQKNLHNKFGYEIMCMHCLLKENPHLNDNDIVSLDNMQ